MTLLNNCDWKQESFCMNTHPDFEEFLKLLSENHIEYMIIGGYAVAYHGFPRFTKDLDIFYLNSPENIRRIRDILIQFGYSPDSITDDIFAEDNIVRFGHPPARIDLLNKIDGLTFPEAQTHCNHGQYGKAKVIFIGRNDLIKNKKASGRAKDLLDVETLELGEMDDYS